jgi:hypothetical protein
MVKKVKNFTKCMSLSLEMARKEFSDMLERLLHRLHYDEGEAHL